MSRLEDLLAAFWERRENGEAVDADAFARAHPDCPGLRAALERLDTTSALFERAGAPRTLGPYRVCGTLGHGASGRVFEVEPPGAPGRRLALKILHPAAGGDPRRRERFRREADVLRRLDHEAIVPVLDHGEHEGCPFLVMERLPGGSLADRIEHAATPGGPGSFPERLDLPGTGPGPRRAARLVATLADAVQAAHDAGVLHRDLKPANVLLREDGRPVLVDFGLAGGAVGATLTGTGDILGTPHFMAPEQARGDEASAATDVYGLGAVLFALLTGAPPHDGDDPLAVLDAVRRRPAHGPRRLDPSVPGGLDRILRRALAWRPRDRFASASALAAALRSWLAGASVAGPPLRARLLQGGLRHRRALAAAGLVLVLAALGGAGAWAAGTTAAEQRRAARARLAEAVITGDEEATESAARAFRSWDPDDPAAVWWSGAREEASGTLADGLRALTAGDAATARAAFERASAADPSDPVAAVLLARAAEEGDDLERAEREWVGVTRLLPRSAGARVRLAWVLRHRERFEQALARMEEAVARAPGDAVVHHDLARMAVYAGHHERALQAVDRAIDLAGEANPLFLRTKAAVLDGLDRREEALALLEDLVAQHPTANHWANLARTYDRAHRLDDARRAYHEVLERRPDDVATLVCLAYLHAGSDREECVECRAAFAAQPELIRPEKVEEFAIRALEADRGHFEHAVRLARYCRRVGRTGEIARKLDALLDERFGDAVLGRLHRARRVLR